MTTSCDGTRGSRTVYRHPAAASRPPLDILRKHCTEGFRNQQSRQYTMARAKRPLPEEAADSSRAKKVITEAQRAVNANPVRKARATGANVAKVRAADDRRANTLEADQEQLSLAGVSKAVRASSSRDVSIDAQPSYTSSGAAQLNSSTHTAEPADTSAQCQSPEPKPQQGKPDHKKAVRTSTRRTVTATGPSNRQIPDKIATPHDEVGVPPQAGFELLNVLQRGKRGSVRKPVDTAPQPASHLHAVHTTTATHVAANVAQHIDAHQQQRSIPTASVQSATMQKRHSRAAQPQGKPVSKPQRDRKHTGSAVSKQSAPVRPAAKAKTVQQSEQAPLDGVYYDCQRLRLLPGDLLLHSERLAAHHKKIASAKKPSHAQQQGASTKHNTAVKFLSGAHVVDVLCEHHQKYAAKATGDEGRLAPNSSGLCMSDRPYVLSPENGCKQAPNPSQEERDLQRSRKTYDEVDVHVRKLLWLRALEQHGRAFADSALAVRDTFVQICLIGQQADATAGPPDMQQSAQACKAYFKMLREVYGPEKVLAPYILNIDAVKEYDGAGGEELHHFRLLQRRIIVYRPTKAAGQSCASPGDSSHPSTQSAHLFPVAGSTQAGCATSAAPAASVLVDDNEGGAQNSGAADGSDTSSVCVDIVGDPPLPVAVGNTGPAAADWDDTLQRLWQDLQEKMGHLTGSKVQANSMVPTEPSCSLLEGSWNSGHCSGSPIQPKTKVSNAIHNGQQNKAGGLQRLYFLDGTFPADLPQGFASHEDIPGLWCGVDQAVNTMLPEALRSCRASSFFKHLCVESTGTASFTFFAPISQVTNITPFHQETQKRRSWNCGSGDAIVQPLSTADSVRKLERVHAAVMGAHKRHGCLLPLEMYLEEDIPLVCYVRDKPYAEMVELPEQSCHCFMSFSNAAAPHPSLKASCNDWHLDAELSSAYLLEKLIRSMKHVGVEAGPPDDGADTWVASPYAMLEPCTIQGPHDPRCTGTWRRPWADEMEGDKCTPEELEMQSDLAHRSCSMDVLLVRTVEKVVDAVQGKLRKTEWNAPLAKAAGLKVLQDALPVIMDLQLCARRQTSPSASTCCSADASSVHFSRKYMDVMVGEVQQALKDEGRDEAAQQAKALLSSSVSAAQATSGDSAAQDSDQGPAASTSCSVPRQQARQKKARQGRVRLVQAEEGGMTGGQPQPSTSTQWSGASAASPRESLQATVVSAQSPAKAAVSSRQDTSAWAAVANLGIPTAVVSAGQDVKGEQSLLMPWAQQPCKQQQAGQSAAASGGKRMRNCSDEVVGTEPAAKRGCGFHRELHHMVRTDQVFSIYMHLKHATEVKPGIDGESYLASQEAADKLKAFGSAVAAVTEAELLQLGLPVLRAHWLLAMQQEWEACQLMAFDAQLVQLGKARAHRCWLEGLHDVACKKIVDMNAKQWGALPPQC